MPSLKKINAEAGTDFRRWKEVTKALTPKEVLPVFEAPVTDETVAGIIVTETELASATPPLQEEPMVDRPNDITRNGKYYQPIEIMHDWYPETTKHLDAVPLANMLEALELESFTEYGTLWIERIDQVANGYHTVENPLSASDIFLIPMPEGWGVIRDYQPEDLEMDSLLGGLEDVLKYDVHYRHIAPLTVIEGLLERFKVRPLTWNFTRESWLIPKWFRDREVGVPGLMESYEIKAREGREAVPAEFVPDDVRVWYEAEYGSKAHCEICNGDGTVFNRKTYGVDFCTACDGNGKA